MPLLKRGETFATGMVRPKTTALFFDKLWVHPALIKGFEDDNLEPHRVPAELCVTEPLGASDYYDSWLTQYALVASGRYGMQYTEYTDVAEALRRLNAETWDLSAIFQVEAWQHFEDMESPLWKQLGERFNLWPPQDWGEVNSELYISTHRRNEAIRFVVQVYAERGVELTPVYLTPSEYDEVTTQESDGLAVCLDHIPTVVDSELAWEQVLEFRHDEEARLMLDRLRRWFAIELLEKSQEEIRNILGKRLDDYQWALKKHGIQTVTGGITGVISFILGPAVAQLLTASPLAVVMGGVVLASGVAAWIEKKRIEKADIERDEVAYIYEARKLGL